jgi:hypothetical protein
MNGSDLVPITKFRPWCGSMQLRFIDTNELIVSWPASIAPKTHADACAEALSLSRKRHGSLAEAK